MRYTLKHIVLFILMLVIGVVTVTANSEPVQAATLMLTTSNPAVAADGQCALIEAIINANNDDQSGSVDCAAGNGDDTIEMNGYTILLTTAYGNFYGMTGLPPITAGLTLQNGTIDGSAADDFRLLYTEADLTLNNVTLSGGGGANFTARGAGIYPAVGNLVITDSVLTNHHTQTSGGAIHGSRITVTNSLLSGNRAGQQGGAIYGRDIYIRRSQLVNNQANEGGAIYTVNTTGYLIGEIYNTLLAGNRGLTSGGALYNEAGKWRMINVTIAGNAAPSGGGIYHYDSVGHQLIEILSSIVWGNSSQLDGGPIADYKVTNSLIQGGYGIQAGNLNVSPRFVNPMPYTAAPTAAGDYQLMEASAAIDRGDDSTAGLLDTLDLAGNPRQVDDSGTLTASTIDRGAYEFQGTSCTGYTYPYTVTGGTADLIMAVACANATGMADSIDLNGGTYNLSNVYVNLPSPTVLPVIFTPLTLENGTLDAGGAGRHLYVRDSGTLVLRHVTLQNGGDGVHVVYGGSIHNRGTLTVEDSVLSGNQATGGGGAIYTAGTASLLRSQVMSNIARERGGGIYNTRGILTVDSSVLSGNEGGDSNAHPLSDGGGALYSTGQDVHTVIKNSLLTGNISSAYGTAIFQEGKMEIINSTLAGNGSASGNSNYGVFARGGTALTVVNSIVWDNDGISIGKSVSSESGATVSHSLIQGGFSGADNLNAYPRFVDPVSAASAPTLAGNYQLQAISPAIDAGDASPAFANGDLIGNPRPVDDPGIPNTVSSSTLDIGAYEFQGTSCAGYTYPYTVTGGTLDLIDAIGCANPQTTGTSIDLNGGTYTLSVPFAGYPDATALPEISSTLTIQNGTLDGGSNDVRLLYVESIGQLTLENMTLQNGGGSSFGGFGGAVYVDGVLTVRNSTLTGNQVRSSGGAIYNNGSTLTVQNSTLTGNKTLDNLYSYQGEGGGAIFTTGSATLTDSNFTGNTAHEEGGAIYNDGSLTITSSTFEGNTAHDGGAIASHINPLTVTDSTFTGNEASYDGGVLYGSGTITFDTCVIRGNQGSDGIIQVRDASIDILNSLLSGNRASPIIEGRSGATVRITNSTIAGNASTGYQGTIFIREVLTISNSIISGNAAPQIFALFGAAVTIENSIVQGGYEGTGALDADPQFVNPEPVSNAPNTAGDYRLRNGSIAIDSGSNTLANNAGTGSTDLDGNPRFTDDPYVLDTGEGTAPLINMGAYESVSTAAGTDVNQDGIVSPTDAMYVINRIAGSDLTADVDGNSLINADDVTAVQNALGN